jgi:hypothetical protein
MRTPFLLLLFISISFLSAIDLNLPQSAVHNATNNLNLIYPTPSSMSMNPAICSPGIETSTTYLFNLEELPKYDFHLVFPFGNCSFHLGDSYLDHEFYKENIAVVGFNYSSHYLTAGFNMRLLNSKVENYKETGSTIVDGGLKWSNSNISSALAIRNITQSKYAGNTLPIVYLWESCYQITKSSRISFGLEKENEFDFSFKFAGRYDIMQTLSLISSYQFEPNRIGIGAVFNLFNFNLVYSVRTHQYLNLTHYISLSYEIIH